MKFMKQMRYLFVVLLVAISLISCKSIEKAETPEEVTKAFVTAFITADFNNMYKYTRSNNKEIIQQLEKTTDDAQRERMKNVKVEFQNVTCKMENDSLAECSCHYTKDGAKRNVDCCLCKEDGKWVVDLIAHVKNQ